MFFFQKKFSLLPEEEDLLLLEEEVEDGRLVEEAQNAKSRSMNRIALRDDKLILRGMEATTLNLYCRERQLTIPSPTSASPLQPRMKQTTDPRKGCSNLNDRYAYFCRSYVWGDV